MFSYACVECVAFIAELDMGLKRSEWVEEEIQRVLNNLRCIGWKPPPVFVTVQDIFQTAPNDELCPRPNIFYHSLLLPAFRDIIMI